MYYIMSMSLILVWFQRAMHAQISDLILYTYENHGNFSKKNSLENPVDRGAWWAAVHGVAQNQTRLKWLSMHACIGEGNGNPLLCSCLENPRDRGAWWAAVCGVAQSWTQLKRLSMHACIGEGNGNTLQHSCLENPRDRGAWWAAIYGVTQSQTRLKQRSSSEAHSIHVYNMWPCWQSTLSPA